MRVGLQLGPVQSCGTLPGARPVPAIEMDCQSSGEKQPQNFKQIMLNGNKLFLPSCVMIWTVRWLCVSGGQRKGEGERRAEMELCLPVTCSPVDALGSLRGDYDISKIGAFFNSQTVFLLEGEQASYSQL